jgi:hypothetical protein
MATPSRQISSIRGQQDALERRAREDALMKKEIVAKSQAKNLVVDAVSGDTFKKRPLSLTDRSDFTKNANVASTLSQFAIMVSPGVKLGLELAFAGVKESYGHEYVALRTYGKIRDATAAPGVDINFGRLVVIVQSPMGVEKTRLLDTGIQRFNGSSGADRNSLLAYQVPETFRATQGDFIQWLLNSPTVIGFTGATENTFFTMEVLALELQRAQ